MVAASEVNTRSPCADDHRRGLARIAETLDAALFVMMCNLANLDVASAAGWLT